MSLAMGWSPNRATLAIRKNDLYETPTVAVQALQKVEQLPECVWECCCGPGNIVKILRKSGHRVYATDLVDYGLEDSEHGVDFLMERHPDFYIGAIVTNPPFKLAKKFVVHALNLCIPKIIILARLSFYESVDRSAILDCGKLSKIYAFSKRLPMMHRSDFVGVKNNHSGVAFAWFVWERDYSGPTIISRLDWSV